MEWTLLHVRFFALGMVFSTEAHAVVSVFESEPAELQFRYPCGSTEVTLQQGNEAPFYYKMRNTESVVPASYSSNRFTVEDTTEGTNCSVHLAISSVGRGDAGTYYCKSYKNDSVFPESTSVVLNVEFCPGKVLCEWMEKLTFEVNGWTILSCTASAGSLPGHIACYQNGETVPPKTAPVEVNGTLLQNVWVRSNSKTVFCCSTVSKHPAKRCQICTDPLWNSSTDADSTTTDIPGSTTSNENPSVRHTPPTTQPITFENSRAEYHGTQWLIIGLVIVILILFVRLVIYCRAFHNQGRLKNKHIDKKREVQDTQLIMELDDCSQQEHSL